MFDLAFLAGLAVWKWSSEPGSQERCSGVFHRRGKAGGRGGFLSTKGSAHLGEEQQGPYENFIPLAVQSISDSGLRGSARVGSPVGKG